MGITDPTQTSTYPFQTDMSVPASGSGTGVNQTFNIQPSASAAGQPQQATGFKKGGKVRSASKRADGCAVRGRTRA